ncbi:MULTISPECIES: hypothetical protein [Curtobacterium]|jgi:hypothetical protein|uniref:Uncharacterized protein n=1 Tax=Curtobacterium citri TaxID=3055139 RepID=A0ABT7T9B3_9MICO|nr:MULTISPECIES: hypothetical protein [Curtobacterium]MDM7885524.1 hypothetical protein [Curtobacterium citri]
MSPDRDPASATDVPTTPPTTDRHGAPHDERPGEERHDAVRHDADPETLEALSHDTQSGEADYVATSPGGSGTERHVPTPDEEQGRGSEYDPVDQGPQQEGQGG